MAEYIERVRAKELLRSHYFPTDQSYESDRNWAVGFNAGLDKAIHKIHYAPSADVAPVVHGRWNLNKHYGDYECSVCKQGDVTIVHRDLLKLNYCPNCGARMDGE